jgi:general stress protein YciG
MKKIPSEVREYLARIGAKGGASKSEKKLKSISENGKKGGWHAQKRNQTEPEAA